VLALLAGGPTTPQLAAAVCDAGDLGFLAAGYLTAAALADRITELKRTMKAATVADGLGFPHAAQAIKITRRTRRTGSSKWRTETSYAIISLPAHQATPAQIARWLRGHWKASPAVAFPAVCTG